MNKLRKKREVVYESTPPFPRNMLVELTNLCNHNCIFCAHNKMKRKQGFCDRDKMIDIIEQAFLNGTREIGFYMAGEPFLNKDLDFFVEKSKNIGFEYIYITTNGVKATKKRVKKLYELGLSSIKFSIDAGTREVYKKIHGKDDYDVVIQNIKDLIELKNNGMELGLFASFCILKSNKEEVEMFMKKIGKYLDDVNIVEAFEQCGQTPELIEELINPNAKLGKIPCEMLFNRLHITYEGYLNACCLDMDNMLVVADLNKMSLAEAWNCQKMVELRKEHLTGKIGNVMCYNCIYGILKQNIIPLTPELSCNKKNE